MDVKQDLFQVTLEDTGAPTKELLFKAIEDLSYTSSLADGATFSGAPKAGSANSDTPAIIQKALDEARAKSKKFVIVKGTGDN